MSSKKTETTNLPTNTVNTLSVLDPNKSIIIQLSDGLTVNKLALQQSKKELLTERLELLRVLYKDAKKRMEAYKKEAKDINTQLETIETVENLQSIDGLIIGKMIADCDKQLNVNKGFSANQIDYLVSDLKTAYPLLRLEELAYILRRGIMGHFGKTDFRFDAQIIHLWIKNYTDEKAEMITRSLKEKEEQQKRFSFIGR